MKKIPLISIIIPFYNSEQYLDKCLTSVIRQTYKNIEIILINDGSTDNSLKIANKFKCRDSRIKILSQKNKGQGAARNLGINQSTGEYISFVDADDYVSLDYIEYLYTLLEKTNFIASLSICSYTEIYQKSNKHIDKGSSYRGILSGNDCLKKMCYEQEVNSCAYTKLISRKLFTEKEFFPETKIYEDLGAIYKLFLRSNIVACGFKSKYYYQIHSNSTLSRPFQKDNLVACDMVDELADNVKKYYPDLKKATRAYQVSIRLSLVNQLINNKNSPYQKILISYIKKYQFSVINDENFNKSKKIAIFLLNFGINIYYWQLKIYMNWKR